jgi:hypothetical protein
MVVIDHLAHFTLVRQLRMSEPLQLHLELADLLEYFSVLGLKLFLVLAVSSEQITGAIQRLSLPLGNLWINGVQRRQ